VLFISEIVRHIEKLLRGKKLTFWFFATTSVSIIFLSDNCLADRAEMHVGPRVSDVLGKSWVHLTSIKGNENSFNKDADVASK
jgi:hypothetical protein